MDEPQELVWTPEMVERYWAFLATRPDSYFSAQRGADIARMVARHVPRGAEVLDYGCGPGFLIPQLLANGFRVVGADLSADTIGSALGDAARSDRFGGLYSLDELLDQGRQFDAVTLIEVVEHLYDDALGETFRNARHLLRPGGSLIVTTPNREDRSLSMVRSPTDGAYFHIWQHVRSWSAETLSDALRRSGFSVRATAEVNFRSNPTMTRPLKRVLARAYGKMRPPISLVAIATPSN
ncbi:MAG: class I SAM-dependent methyltransferase [Rhodospirillaceae bacterium]|nr:class I SAM-dependent methyltransferase [Rhodospirillaceae bacterium]MCA8933318.1 class I SAM-dependent methyltransferase [Rhodospirillaceae bacterium]